MKQVEEHMWTLFYILQFYQLKAIFKFKISSKTWMLTANNNYPKLRHKASRRLDELTTSWWSRAHTGVICSLEKMYLWICFLLLNNISDIEILLTLELPNIKYNLKGYNLLQIIHEKVWVLLKNSFQNAFN